MFLLAPRPSLRPRALTPGERQALLEAHGRHGLAPAEVFERALDRTRLVPFRGARLPGPRRLLAQVALGAGADGITLGRRVFIPPRLFGPGGEVPLDLVAHEVAHVVQYLRDGELLFVLRYATAYAAGRLRGLTEHRAYLAIPYEVEARAFASALGGRAGGA